MIAILFLRRIPFLLMVYKFVPEISSWKEALLSGHFGPMGVGAVFVSSLALTRLPTPEHPPADQAQFLAATIQPIVSFVVLGSIIVHGLSIPLFSIGRSVHCCTTLSLTNHRVMDMFCDIRGSAVNGDIERGFVAPGVTSNGLAVEYLPTTEHVDAGLSVMCNL